MEEFQEIFKKYQSIKVPEVGCDIGRLLDFSPVFFTDVAEIYDINTRLKNEERNPSGFDLNDAPILGLLVKISKLLREIVVYYKAGDANIISYLERQAIEAGIVAQYLLQATPETIENYRKCSYKDRLRILEAPENEGFYATKAGKRLKADVLTQLNAEGFSTASFEVQKKHNWKVDGKSIRDMFKALGLDALYGNVYGLSSESIHASWGHSMNFDLHYNEDQTYSAYPIEMPADIRYVAPVVELCNPAFIGWSKRVNLNEHDRSLKWIASVNRRLFYAFDAVYAAKDG
ncbi:DUF5677 domain-containing protein [Ruegeria arenilitoris]|uniref:DUF5677 domain-containing protein n=1 Tax=Ruegeria arenilitoris TaxID=1173585 RepID=UPI00147B3B70|nr:DUF5677 domain-containing protein [Ruegeria arenilitoris]